MHSIVGNDRFGFLAESNSFTLGCIKFYESFRFLSLKIERAQDTGAHSGIVG